MWRLTILSMARGSKLAITLQAADVPLLTQAASLAHEGFVTGASHRNWSSYGAAVRLPEDGMDLERFVAAVERELIEQSLARAGGNKEQAARLLNMKRTTLVEKLKRMNRSVGIRN